VSSAVGEACFHGKGILHWSPSLLDEQFFSNIEIFKAKMQTPRHGPFGDLAAGSNRFLAFKAKFDVFSSIYVGYWIDSEAKPFASLNRHRVG
jgi:hypothetical protein